ncbi:MAG: insulinase family protein [Deltaproteobacteria bacterium]|nr:insulinase family protein [Deltaproteobacteria bacterium]
MIRVKLSYFVALVCSLFFACVTRELGITLNDPSKILPVLVVFGKVGLDSREHKAILPLFNEVWNDVGSKSYPREDGKKILLKHAGEIKFSIFEDGRFIASVRGVSPGFHQLVDLFFDKMLNPVFDPITLDLQKKLVCENLLRNREKPINLALITTRFFLFENYQLLNCEDVASVDVSTIETIHRKLKFVSIEYLINRPTSSDLGIISDSLKKLPKSQVFTEYRIPKLKKTKVIWVEGPFSQTTTLLASPTEALNGEHRYFLKLFELLLSGDFDSPIFKSIRSEEGLAYMAHAGWAADFEKGFFYMLSQHSLDKLPEVLVRIKEVFSSISSESLGEEIRKVWLRESRRLAFRLESPFDYELSQGINRIFRIPKNDDERFLNFVRAVSPLTVAQNFKNLVDFASDKPLVLVIVHRDNPVNLVSHVLKDFEFLRAKFDDKFKLIY